MDNQALADYQAAFDRPNDPRAAAAIRQGMPPTPNRALLSYGNQEIVPPADELPGLAMQGLENMTAFSPYGPEMHYLMQAPGALNRAMRGPPDLPPAGPQPGPSRPVGPPPGPTTAVPSVAPPAPAPARPPPFNPDEFTQVMDELRRNPYSQAIPGRQGIPSKAEQLRLARRAFDDPTVRGPEAASESALSPAPWGRSTDQLRDDIRRLLQESVEAERARLKPPSGTQ